METSRKRNLYKVRGNTGNTATPASEIQLQAKCFQWTWNTFPETRRLFFHVPNGGRRGMIESTQLKASGVVAGIPDMILAWKGKIYAFEFKSNTGRLSDVQSEVLLKWKEHTIPVFVIHDEDNFKSTFKSIIA